MTKFKIPITPNLAETFREYEDQAEADASWVPSGAGYAVDLRERVIVGVLQGGDANDNRVTFDLQQVLGAGVNASDTKWTLRGKISIRQVTPTSGLPAFLFGLTDTDTSQNTNQQSIIGIMDMFSIIPIRYGGASRFNSQLPIQANVFDRLPYTTFDGAVYYFQLIRHSETWASYELFLDPEYKNTISGPAFVEVPTTAFPGSITNLRFIKWYERQIASTGTYTFAVSDVEFWNDEVPEEFPENETEYADDFTIDKGWVSTDLARLNIGGGALQFDASGTGIFNDVLTFDLGTGLPDAGWVLRFKFKINTLVQGTDNTANDLYFGLSNNVNSPIGSQDLLGMRTFASALSGGDFQRFTIAVVNNGNPGTVVISSFAFGPRYLEPDTWYVEFARLATDKFRMRVYMDETFSQLWIERTETIPIGITQLRFIKAMVANFDGSGDSTYDGIIDDVKLWINTPATKKDEMRTNNG